MQHLLIGAFVRQWLNNLDQEKKKGTADNVYIQSGLTRDVLTQRKTGTDGLHGDLSLSLYVLRCNLVTVHPYRYYSLHVQVPYSPPRDQEIIFDTPLIDRNLSTSKWDRLGPNQSTRPPVHPAMAIQ